MTDGTRRKVHYARKRVSDLQLGVIVPILAGTPRDEKGAMCV